MDSHSWAVILGLIFSAFFGYIKTTSDHGNHGTSRSSQSQTKRHVFVPVPGYRGDYFHHYGGKELPFLPIPPPPSQHVIHSVKTSDSKLFNKGRPTCANDFEYCTLDQDYPLAVVQDIVARYYVDTIVLYDLLYGRSSRDPNLLENITRFNDPRGDFICASGSNSLKIGWAKTIFGHWVAVINTERFKQITRVEFCKNPNGACNYVPYCSKSSCKQRFSVTRLLTVDPTRPDLKPSIETFAFPTTCACFVENLNREDL